MPFGRRHSWRRLGAGCVLVVGGPFNYIADANPPTGAGHVTHYVEHRACRAQVMMAHLTGFIFEGVFERFLTFKVVLQEAGVFRIPVYLWRLDQDWKALRMCSHAGGPSVNRGRFGVAGGCFHSIRPKV
ncbi:MAG: amidohydrolase [Paenibacillus sp.]|nr:amidohydrolase [Paenibacillus sp.]